MKKVNISVSVDLDCEYLDDVDIEIEISDASYNILQNLSEELDELDSDECQDLLLKQAPELLNEIDAAVDNVMPEEIDLQDDESIDDYSWEPEYNSITFE